MDRVICFSPSYHPSILEEINFGELGSCAVDQSPCLPFNIDPETGNPMSTIDVILKAQGLEQRRALESLQEYKGTFLPDGISDIDALRYAVPRLCQLPSELAEWSVQCEQHAAELAEQKANEKRLRDLFIDSDDDVKN